MWQMYMQFMEKNKRRPSKYKAAEMNMVNWLKHNRKLLNKEKLLDSRKEKLDQLLAKAKEVQRINQYAYTADKENEPTLFQSK